VGGAGHQGGPPLRHRREHQRRLAPLLDFDKDNGLERTNANSIGSPCVFRTVEQVAHEEARAAAYAVLADVGLKPDGYQGHGLSSEMLFALAATAKEVSGS
jgi:hypothetical protein